MLDFIMGLDPGKCNLGVALLRETNEKVQLVASRTFDPTTYGPISSFIDVGLHRWINDAVEAGMGGFLEENPDHARMDWDFETITIERYVTYGQVITSETETICGTIGALTYFFEAVESDSFQNSSPILVRAIDWKIPLCQYLVKNKGFDNPSTSLDKKFSMAAAKACLDNAGQVNINTDHEADAICLAYIGYLHKTKKIKLKGIN